MSACSPALLMSQGEHHSDNMAPVMEPLPCPAIPVESSNHRCSSTSANLGPELDVTKESMLESPASGLVRAAPGGTRSWRDIFRMRCVKQRSWDTKKRGKKSPDIRPSDAGKTYNKVSMDAKEKKVPAKRLKTCRRCGSEYDPNDGSLDACRWHSGRFAAMDEAGTFVNASTGSNLTAQNFERRAQQLIKANSRKKASKKAGVIVFGAACDSGVAREDGISWRWSCCSAENLIAPGCVAGRHS